MRSVVLIGASVGKAWHLHDFPSRAGMPFVRAEYRGLYRFDKTLLLDELLQGSATVPDAVILKECAAYFPVDQDSGRRLMSGWVEQCRNAGAVPVPATVAPVTRIAHKPGALNALFRRLRGRPGAARRLDGIIAFNDWIREYSREEQLIILDLERCLRVSGDDRSLRADLHSGDGLHLNQKAYSMLDRELNRVVRELFPEIGSMRSS